jgi:hypothetical protein
MSSVNTIGALGDCAPVGIDWGIISFTGVVGSTLMIPFTEWERVCVPLVVLEVDVIVVLLFVDEPLLKLIHRGTAWCADCERVWPGLVLLLLLLNWSRRAIW